MKYSDVKEIWKDIETGVCKRNILQVINHQDGRKQAGGYIWKCEKEVVK